MTETDNSLRDPDKRPEWVKRLVSWLGIATAIVVAVTALLAAVGKLSDAAAPACRLVPLLPWCEPKAAQSSPIPKPPPQLAAYDSPEVDGGHNQAEYCEPRKAAYQSQYPDFDITWLGSETNKKDLLGHVTYRYHCEFIAAPKAAKK